MDFVKKKPKHSKKAPRSLPKFIGIVLGGLLVGLIGLFYYFLLPQKGRTTIALVSDSVTLISLDHEKNTLTIVPVPSNTYLAVAQGKGNLKISSLYKFDLLSKQKGFLLTSTLREFFGIPLDGWINIPGFKINNIEDFLKFQKQEFTFFSRPPSSTNFSLLFLKRFYFKINQIRQDKINYLALLENGAFQNEVLADGSNVLQTDAATLDSLVKDNFFEWKILEENLSIAVLNSSQTSGLASRVARIITESGGKVIKVGESNNKMVDCKINLLPKFRNYYTVTRYQKVFRCEIEEKMLDEQRADMVITIGAAYEKEIMGP